MLFTATYIIYILAVTLYLVYFYSQNKQVRLVARRFLLAAGIIHIVLFLFRYFEAGHTPLTTHHDTVSFFALSVTWAFLSFRWRYQIKNFGTFVSVVIIALMTVAMLSARDVAQLPPALQSTWLPVHASIAILANGFLALGFCGGLMYLIQDHELKKKRFTLFYHRLPSLDALDN